MIIYTDRQTEALTNMHSDTIVSMQCGSTQCDNVNKYHNEEEAERE